MASNLKRSPSSIICFLSMKEHSRGFSFPKGCSIFKMYVTFLSLSHTKQNVKHWCDKAKETNQEAPSSSFLLWPVLKLSQHQFLSTKYIRGGLFQCRFCVCLCLLLLFYNYIIESIKGIFLVISTVFQENRHSLGRREGRMNRWGTRDFYGSETPAYDTTMMSTYH